MSFRVKYFIVLALLFSCYGAYIALSGNEINLNYLVACFMPLAVWNAIRSYKEIKPVNPFEMVRFEGSAMYVGDESFNIDNVTKVALDKDDKHAYFSLPFNTNHGLVMECYFDIAHYHSFKDYLATHIPEVSFVK